MANLRVNKITSTETFEKTGSVQFIIGGSDATRDRLTIASNSDFTTSGDFTIEAWIYAFDVAESGGLARSIFSIGDHDSSTGFLFYLKSDGLLSFYTGSDENNTTFKVDSSTWHHVALVRSGEVITIYADGKFIASYGYDNTFSGLAMIAGNSTNGSDSVGGFSGHLSNVRYINGKALYTKNFKPPMRELEVTPETVLLACQSKTDASLEKTGKTITVNGGAFASELTPGILTPVPKAGAGSAITGSVEFTGDPAKLEATSTDFAMGDSDLTMECWFYNGVDTITHLVQIDIDGGATNFSLATRDAAAGDVRFLIRNDSGSNLSDLVAGAPRAKINMWHHLAGTIEGTTTRLFLNGILIASGTISGTRTHTGEKLTLGANETSRYLKGYLSNVRIVKGTALYTHDFIPPTRELKKVPGTVLLCCQDPNNPTTEATGKTITGYGNLDADTSSENLITNGNFTTSASDGWTVVEGTGTTVLGGAQSGTFGNGEHLVLTATSGSFVFLGQQFTTKIGSTYLVNVQSNGADESFISTDSDKDNAIITDIRNTGGNNKVGNQMFVATQTSYHMILRGGTGGGNFDTASVYKVLTPNGASDFTPQVGDDRSVILDGVTNMNTENYFYLPTGDTVTRDSRSGRGVFGGGNPGTASNVMQYVQIQSQGNALDFGDLTVARQASGLGSATRGVFGGNAHPNGDTMDFITIASTGNAIDFGNLQSSLNGRASAASSTRGIFAGGGTPSASNEIDFITIASKGDATNFGDLTAARRNHAGVASPIRAAFAGGDAGPTTDTIDFVTIASTGNAVDFGNLSAARETAGGASSSTRGVFMGGYTSPGDVDVIEYITIASKGDAKDFGNLSAARRNGGGVSNNIRGLYAGGHPSVNTIEFVTIASTGDANDFGDLLVGQRINPNHVSDSHGGLG